MTPQDAKLWVDLYGVGVRAGAITPQVEDEDFIRDKLGLPKMTHAARSDWAKTGGIRRPITLQHEDDMEPEEVEND